MSGVFGRRIKISLSWRQFGDMDLSKDNAYVSGGSVHEEVVCPILCMPVSMSASELTKVRL